MRNFKRQQQGFTFIELLIALGIFSVGLLAICTTVIAVINSNAKSKHLTTAVHLAQNKIDHLKTSSYASVADGTETDLDENETSGGIYSRQVSVIDNTNPDYKTVTVTVSWAEGTTSRQVVLKTIIAQ